MTGDPKPKIAAATNINRIPETSNSNLSDSQAQTPNNFPSVFVFLIRFL